MLRNFVLERTKPVKQLARTRCHVTPVQTVFSLLLVFSVTPFKIDQNKNQNRSIDKVKNLGNERR